MIVSTKLPSRTWCGGLFPIGGKEYGTVLLSRYCVVENADADCHSLLKASALLRYVEQISSMHARKFGMDDKFFEDHGVAFLVGKQALRFNRVPRRGETLTLCSRSERLSAALSSASPPLRTKPGRK